MYTSDEGSSRPRRDRTYWLIRGLALLVALAVLVTGVAVVVALSRGDNGDDDTNRVTTADVVSPGTSGKPVTTQPAVYLLEVTGSTRVMIAVTVGGSTTSYGRVKLPWRRVVPETADYIGITVSADSVTTKSQLRCRIDHRDESGRVEEVTSAAAEPGQYVSLGCDKI